MRLALTSASLIFLFFDPVGVDLQTLPNLSSLANRPYCIEFFGIFSATD